MRWTPGTIAASAVALAMVGGAAAMALSGGEGVRDEGGPGVHIALFTPPEPTPVEGPVMDVGPLVDGYEHHPFVQQAAYEGDYPTAWLDEGGYDPPPSPEPRAMVRVMTSEPPADEAEAMDAVSERPLSFGFDQPRPDYAEARRQRQARMDAMTGEAPGPRPDGMVAPPPAAPRGPDMFY